MPERKHTAGEIINKWEMPLRAEIVCLLLLLAVVCSMATPGLH